MKKFIGYTVGFLGLCFVPFAIIVVAFRSSCKFVSIIALEGLDDET